MIPSFNCFNGPLKSHDFNSMKHLRDEMERSSLIQNDVVENYVFVNDAVEIRRLLVL